MVMTQYLLSVRVYLSTPTPPSRAVAGSAEPGCGSGARSTQETSPGAPKVRKRSETARSQQPIDSLTMGHRHEGLRRCSLVASNRGTDRTPATMMTLGGGAPRRSLTTRQSTPRRFAPRSEIRDPRPGECERGGHATGTRVSRPFEQRVRRLSRLSRGRPDRWSKTADEPGAQVSAAMFPFEQLVEEARIPGRESSRAMAENCG